MDFATIQEKIEKRAAKEATEEFHEAVDKCAKILSPYFKGGNEASGIEDADARALLKDLFRFGAVGIYRSSMYDTLDNDGVPAIYLRIKKKEACDTFIERVSNLSSELEEIRDIAEDAQSAADAANR